MKFITSILLLLLSLSLSASPARGDTVTVLQPDGTPLSLMLTGDEHIKYHTTTDGVIIAKDITGYWYYVSDIKDGEPILSGIIAHNIDGREPFEQEFITKIRQKALLDSIKVQRDYSLKSIRRVATRDNRTDMLGAGNAPYSTTGFPTRGEVKGLVVLVEFPDKSFSLSHDEIYQKYYNRLNGIGLQETIVMPNTTIYTEGSAKEYFIDQSKGLFKPTFDIVGPIMASHGYAYYGENDKDGNDYQNAKRLISEVTNHIYDNGLADLTDYDNNNDGYIDFIFVIYAGRGENYTNSDPLTIWPHQGYINNRYGSVTASSYACTCELYHKSEDIIDGIGVFCHEFSHILGLPDFYPTTSNNTFNSTLQYWSIMDRGNYGYYGFVPVGYTALEKYSLGWLNFIEVTEPGRYTLQTIQHSDFAYILPSNESQSSYIVIEAHSREDWYRAHQAEGVMITAVDYNSSIWRDNTVNNDKEQQRYMLLPADNNTDVATAQGDLFPYNNNDSLTLFSTPPSVTGCGIQIDIPIHNIKYENGVAEFTIQRRTTSITEPPHQDSVIAYNITYGGIELSNIVTPLEVSVTDLEGRTIYRHVAIATDITIPLPHRGIYLLKVGDSVQRILY